MWIQIFTPCSLKFKVILMEWMCLFTTASICKGTVWTISTWIELSYINKWVSNDLVVGHPLRFCSSTVPDGTAIWKCWFKRAGGNRNIQKNTCCSKNRENQQQHSTQSMASYQEPEPRPNWWKACQRVWMGFSVKCYLPIIFSVCC